MRILEEAATEASDRVTSEAAGGQGLRPARFALLYALGATLALAALYLAIVGTDGVHWGALAGLAAFVAVSSGLLYLRCCVGTWRASPRPKSSCSRR